jgi:hypothetical protein
MSSFEGYFCVSVEDGAQNDMVPLETFGMLLVLTGTPDAYFFLMGFCTFSYWMSFQLHHCSALLSKLLCYVGYQLAGFGWMICPMSSCCQLSEELPPLCV